MNENATPSMFIDKFNNELIALGSSAINANTPSSDYDYAIPLSTARKLMDLLTFNYGFKAIPGSSGSANAKKQYPMFNHHNVKLKFRDTEFDFIVYDDDKFHLVKDAMDNYLRFYNIISNKHRFTDKDFRLEAFQYFLQTAFGKIGAPVIESVEDPLAALDVVFSNSSQEDAFFASLDDE